MSRDFWTGFVVLSFAGLYWLEADKIRISPLDGPVGASGLPKSLAGALAILSLLLMARAVYRQFRPLPQTGPAAAEVQPVGDRVRLHLRAVGMLVIGIAYLLVVPFLGYLVAILLLLGAVSLYIGAALNLRTLAVAVLGAVFFHLLFVEFLGIPLPEGALVKFVMNRFI